MHRIASALAFALPFTAFVTFGCSSSSGGDTPPADTGVAQDEGVAQDSGVDSSKSDAPATDGETSGATTCGSAPYVNVKVHVTEYNSTTPVAGAHLDVSICPGSTFVSDSTGTFNGQISQNTPFDPRFSESSHVTMRLGEEKLASDFETTIPLLPELLTGILPDWDASKPTVLAIVGTAASLGDAGVDAPASDASGPCEQKDGVTIAVTGHPEAKIVYFKDGAIPSADPTLTKTSTAGLAEIAGIPVSAAPLQFTGTKTGCTVTFASSPLTGNYSLANGELTVATGLVGP